MQAMLGCADEMIESGFDDGQAEDSNRGRSGEQRQDASEKKKKKRKKQRKSVDDDGLTGAVSAVQVDQAKALMAERIAAFKSQSGLKGCVPDGIAYDRTSGPIDSDGDENDF